MDKEQPAHKLKLGQIRVAIWANPSKERGVWFTVSLSRLYKSGDGWKETRSLRLEDLPVAMKALDMADTWIWHKQRQMEQAEHKAAAQLLSQAGR